MVNRRWRYAALAAGFVGLLPAGASGQAASDEAAFVLLRGRDTVAVERFRRAPARLESDLSVPAGSARVRFDATLEPDGRVSALGLEARQGAGPASEVALTFRGDSAFAEVAGALQRFAPGAGALPYVNLSISLLEQLVRRAQAVGGARVQLPMLDLAGGQSFSALVVRPSADSASIVLPPGVEVRLRVDREGRVLGGSVPAQEIRIERTAGALPPAAPPPPPDYSAPAGAPYRAEEVTVSTPAGHSLAGTLTLPAEARGPLPAVVLITGSGPQDRDEALPGLPGFRLFRQVADTLSRRGIAVLRLDDRGAGASTGDFAAATTADFADDARAALAFLRQRPEIDAARLGLVGHSEGGLVAPMVAASDPALRAVAILAGPSRKGREILEYQMGGSIEEFPSLSAAARDSALAAIGARIDALAAAQPWMRFFMEYDPLPAAGKVRAPVLILHGATDRQITPEQAEELAAAVRAGGNTDVTALVLPELNHLFLPDPHGSPAGYADLPSREVAPQALGALADWLATRLRS